MGLDSVELIMAVEEEFGIQIPNASVERIGTMADLHEQVRLQLNRDPRPLPQLVLKDRGQAIDAFEPDDFAFENYDPHPHISAPVAV